MTTSVVIPAFNGLHHLKTTLPAVLKLSVGEVIVVDDASTDGTSAYITQHFPQVHLIINPINRRFPTSVNQGFKATSADIVFLLNQDVTPHPNLVKTTLKHFKNEQLFAITFNEGLLGFAKATYSRGFIEYSSAHASSLHPSFWASGGSCAVRKGIWDRLDGFDELFSPGYNEDLDMGWRARKLGYEILWDPGAKVKHVRETAFKAAFPQRYLQRIKDRNFLLTHWKNLDPAELPEHFTAVLSRCLRHPGFIVPVFMALLKVVPILKYRHLQTGHQLPNSAIFSYEKNYFSAT